MNIISGLYWSDPIEHPVYELLEAKRVSPELGMGDPIPEIDEFIEGELNRHGDAFVGQGRPDINESRKVRDELNEIFRCCL